MMSEDFATAFENAKTQLRPRARPATTSAGAASPRGPDASPATMALSLIDPRSWTEPAPPRRWIVEGWVPAQVVTGLYGDGGVGKTLVAQQLLTCVAAGHPWLGLACQEGRVLGIFCEDDPDELQRRQEAINASLGVEMAELENMRLLSRVGEDNALVQFEGADRRLTALHERIVATCAMWRPDLLVLDTAADLFPDNENDRSKVRWFVQTALASIGRDFGCAVVLLAHPSVSGLNSGTGSSGSTAWNNTMRSRLFLAREQAGEDAMVDTNIRILSRKKANYAALDGDVRLIWREGVLHLAGAPVSENGGVSWAAISAIFDEIDRAWQAGKPWSNAPQTRVAGRYLPTWVRSHFDIAPKVTARLVGEWISNGFLGNDPFDTRDKAKGLRVLRRLEAA